LAAKKNSIPLPLVPEKYGLRLPPERHLLIKQNIAIVPKVQVASYLSVRYFFNIDGIETICNGN
jgi:hypothetical protein